MPLKSNSNLFVDKAKKIHGDKYDYSKVNYTNNRTPVEIICPEHGSFYQTPHDHLSGNGCMKCYSDIRGLMRRKTRGDFIVQAKKVHGDKYDYSKTNYVKSNEKVTVTCPVHGDFEIYPQNHLKGQGCKLCGNLKKGQYRKSSTNEFVKAAIFIHGDRYDYSEVDYNGNKIPVKIICPEHGEFLQRPNDHLSGHGCPECAKKFGIKEKYVLNALRESIKQYLTNIKKVFYNQQHHTRP